MCLLRVPLMLWGQIFWCWYSHVCCVCVVLIFFLGGTIIVECLMLMTQKTPGAYLLSVSEWEPTLPPSSTFSEFAFHRLLCDPLTSSLSSKDFWGGMINIYILLPYKSRDTSSAWIVTPPDLSGQQLHTPPLTFVPGLNGRLIFL